MELNFFIYLVFLTLTTVFGTSNAFIRKHLSDFLVQRHSKVFEDGDFLPGKSVDPFSLYTLQGLLKYPGPVINQTTPLLFSLYNEKSGFIQCLFNSSSSVEKLLLHSPKKTNYIFLSTQNAESNAAWMKSRFEQAVLEIGMTGSNEERQTRVSHLADVLSRLHFVTLPLNDLGNWIPSVLKQWTCSDHNCGLDQVLITSDSENGKLPLVLPRLDARYDWLPSPLSVFGKTSQKLVYLGDGCRDHGDVKLAPNTTVLVSYGSCSYFDKIKNVEKIGAKAVVIIAPPEGIQDMKCVGNQCSESINIPATMVQHHPALDQFKEGSIVFQNTPSDNFFMGIDYGGRLAEVRWFLYPSFYFLVWQAQWFDFMNGLQNHLSEEAYVVNIFNHTIMHGNTGAVAHVHLNMGELSKYKHLELDAALSCPGTRDVTCPQWDHTVQLFVSCTNDDSQFELGRWITPFRRRIGRWVTDVSSLIPLLGQGDCQFAMKTVPWAMPWAPSLNLRFSQPATGNEIIGPKQVSLIYQGSFTFDKHYNSQFQPFIFEVPNNMKKALVVSVITGHGSDENQCGEFCNTTHTITVNGQTYTLVNNISGTPLGCALKIPLGVVPNEHGTWLYGRDGWCDGQQVDPWIVDITKDLVKSHELSVNSVKLYYNPQNVLKYRGYFNGTDPDPKQNPGNMIVTIYLVYYW